MKLNRDPHWWGRGGCATHSYVEENLEKWCAMLSVMVPFLQSQCRIWLVNHRQMKCFTYVIDIISFKIAG